MLCGVFRVDAVLAPLLLAMLPDVMVVENEDLPQPTRDLARLLSHEARLDRPGAAAIAQRYAELIFLETLRSLAPVEAGSGSLFAALRHERLARALSAFHANPRNDWTIDRLASIAGMSASAFKRAFTATVGCAPYEYIARWRLALAARRVAETNLKLARIAEEAGFSSDASFSKAFRKAYGSPPAAFRKSSRA